MKNKNKMIYGIAILVTVMILVVGVSYALWVRLFQQNGSNLVYSDCFKITFEDQNDLHLDKAYPMSKEELQKDFFPTVEPYHFTITNQCESFASASINLETLSLDGNKFDDQYINVILYDGTMSILDVNSYYSESSMDLVSHPLNNENKVIPEAINAYSLYNFVLQPKEVREFNLLLFLDEDTPAIDEIMNGGWLGKITLSAAYKFNNGEQLALVENLSFRADPYSVSKIIIQNQLNPVEDAISSYDESLNQDGAVQSYLVSDSETGGIIVYLQANGKIILPEDSSFLFSDMWNLKSIEGLEYLDTSKVTDMSGMFWDCQGLESLDISNFNTRNVTSMGSMFYNCSSLGSLDVSHFDTSQVTDMSGMFQDCVSLTNLDLSTFDTSQVTTMEYMFANCSGLTDLDVSHFDTSNVTSMSFMFSGCSSLTNLDLSTFDTSQATDIRGLFQECMNLSTIIYGSKFVCADNADISLMYDGCPANKPTDISWNEFLDE